MKEKGGIWSCPKCEGTDKWCILELDDERGAVCERHGVIVPNGEVHRCEASAGTMGYVNNLDNGK
jgi:hypothetical protein